MITEKGESDFSEPLTLETPFEQTEMGIFMDEVLGGISVISPLIECCHSQIYMICPH